MKRRGKEGKEKAVGNRRKMFEVSSSTRNQRRKIFLKHRRPRIIKVRGLFVLVILQDQIIEYQVGRDLSDHLSIVTRFIFHHDYLT